MSNRNIASLFFRLILGFVYLTAGFSKLAPNYIGNVIGPSKLPEDLFSIEVLYLFYAMAFLQIVAGTLVLSLRYAGAGLLLLLPLTLAILIFTLVAGFGATPIINVILFGMALFEVFRENDAFSKQTVNTPYIYCILKKVEYTYPSIFPHTTIALVGLSLLTVPIPSIHLNVLLTVALCLIAVMLMRLAHLALIDKTLVLLFTAFGLSIINGIWLKELDPRFFYKALILIPIGGIVGLIRIAWYRFKI
ncbi:MAG TPA: hypothetical protein VJ939_05490 [Bacteroidales bacterium]|nr:hypothetical protein [Bacteroidales bacterium]